MLVYLRGGSGDAGHSAPRRRGRGQTALGLLCKPLLITAGLAANWKHISVGLRAGLDAARPTQSGGHLKGFVLMPPERTANYSPGCWELSVTGYRS